MIRAIVAIDEERGIAANSVIPWNIPSDSRYFRAQTEHGVVIMGKDTYDEFKQPLPNRRNVVASRSLTKVRSGFELTDTIEGFIQKTDGDIWIIGGAGLYASTIELCEELYITHVKGVYGCDRFFPEFMRTFALVEQSDVQEDNGYSFTFAVYKKTGK